MESRGWEEEEEEEEQSQSQGGQVKGNDCLTAEIPP